MITVIIIGIITTLAAYLYIHDCHSFGISIAISALMGFLICLLSTVGIFIVENSLIENGTIRYEISIAEIQELKPIQYTEKEKPIYLKIDLQNRIYNCLIYKKDTGYSEENFSDLKIRYTDDKDTKYTEPCLVKYKITYNNKIARLFLINISDQFVAYIPREGVAFK